MTNRKHEITVMAMNDHGEMVLIDRCTLQARNVGDAAKKYLDLFEEDWAERERREKEGQRAVQAGHRETSPGGIMTDSKPPLTINRAGLLADLVHGVDRGSKLRYYPRGAEDADHPMVQVLRAFTYEGGGLYPHHADVRDAFVWTSGFMEHWFPVPELLCALDNMDGSYGLDQPMAMIDKE